MKITAYSDIEPRAFENDQVKGVKGRVAIGKDDGAKNFCMRVFEIASGGNSPKHAHEWEHEIFIHRGTGEILNNGQWQPIKAGTVIFIPGQEEHQIKNTGNQTLTFICLIPSGVPEL